MRLIVDLSIYFSEQPTDGTQQAARLIKALDSSATPAMRNEKQLRLWLGDYLK